MTQGTEPGSALSKISPRWIALLLVAGLTIYLCWLIIYPFLNVLLWSAVLAIVAYPAYRFLRRRGQSPVVASLITLLLVVVVIIVPVGLMGWALLQQAATAADRLKVEIPRLLGPDSAFAAWARNYYDVDQLYRPEFYNEQLKGAADNLLSLARGLLVGGVGALIQILFVLFALFYLLKDADRIVPAIRSWMPLDEQQADRLFNRLYEVIYASVNGTLVIAAIQATLGGLMFWILGLNSPLFWSVVMFFLSIIPLTGAGLVWAPAAVYLFVTGHYVRGTIMVVVGAGIISTVDNFLRPRLVGRRTRLHELIIFFSVIGGLQVFGVLGLIVGPVVVASTITIIEALGTESVGRKAEGPGPEAT